MANYTGRGVAKVLWAVDAFHEKSRDQLRSFEVITKLFGKTAVSVQPISLLSLGHYNPQNKKFEEKWHDLALAANKNIGALCASVKHPGLLPHHLIKQEGHSVTAAAKELLSYALEDGAHMIVVSSHARKGLGRILIGSFAETLVLHSPLPVLVVNPQSKAKSAVKLKRVLFPTDFSDMSKKAFQRTVSLSAQTGMAILLFHKIQYLNPEFGPLYLFPAVDAQSLKEVRDSYKAEAQKWIDYAEQRGVKVTFHLDTSNGRPLDEILRAAKKLGNTAMIAMASQSGGVGAVVMGSLTRQVLREAPCPIMVLHPEEESMLKHFADTVKLAGYHYTARPAYF